MSVDLNHHAIPADLRARFLAAVRAGRDQAVDDLGRAIYIELEEAGAANGSNVADVLLAGAEYVATQKAADEQAERSESPFPALLDLLDLAQREPAPPASIVRDWLPAGEVSLLAGHGGSGKSAIGLYLAACIASGRDFFGIPTARRRVFVLSLEDPAPVIHWRLRRICTWIGVDLAALADWLTVADGAHVPAELYAELRDGPALTAAYDWLAERMAGHDVLVIDNASDAYGANEIVRRHVRAFVRAIRRLIPPTGAALLLAHVDKSAARAPDTSQGYSGSTAWSNSVRARWYLRPDGNTGDLLLELQKANHGPAGAQVRIRWNEAAHVFVGDPLMPAGRLDRAMAEADDRERLVEIIRAADPPIPAAATGPRTAYTAMQARGLPDAYARDKRRFWRDLEALRAAGKIVDVEHRTPDRKRRLVLRVA